MPAKRKAPTNVAYSLIRFANPQSLSSDRYRRLEKTAETYAAAHGLSLDKTGRTTLGISAYGGKKGGDPATQFLRTIDDGLIVPDSTLLVESLEGIPPSNLKNFLMQFLEIISRGITIVTFPDKIAHNSKTIADNPERLVISFSAMITAQNATELRRKIALQSVKGKASES